MICRHKRFTKKFNDDITLATKYAPNRLSTTGQKNSQRTKIKQSTHNVEHQKKRLIGKGIQLKKKQFQVLYFLKFNTINVA